MKYICILFLCFSFSCFAEERNMLPISYFYGSPYICLEISGHIFRVYEVDHDPNCPCKIYEEYSNENSPIENYTPLVEIKRDPNKFLWPISEYYQCPWYYIGLSGHFYRVHEVEHDPDCPCKSDITRQVLAEDYFPFLQHVPTENG